MRKLIPLVLLLAACRGEHADREQTAPAPAATTAAAATAANAATIVRSASGADVLTIRNSGEAIEIAAGGRTLVGEERDSGKRKYAEGDAVAYEVKPGDDGGFKLRTAGGALRWKVKIAPEKIRISDNEENENPFELKAREGDRTKVFAPGDRELGNVRFDRAASKTNVENASGQTLFVIDGAKPSAAYGVLLLDAIPEAERAILVAEILSRGR